VRASAGERAIARAGGQFTKTFGLPVTLVSTIGPYLAVNVPEPGQKPLDPDPLLNVCLEKLTVLPLFDAWPEMLAATKIQVIVPTPETLSTAVVVRRMAKIYASDSSGTDGSASAATSTGFALLNSA
jgi:hypothetical protein